MIADRVDGARRCVLLIRRSCLGFPTLGSPMEADNGARPLMLGGARFPLALVLLLHVGLREEDERRLDARAEVLGGLGVREVELEEDRVDVLLDRALCEYERLRDR
jgi:hypothetical protein